MEQEILNKASVSNLDHVSVNSDKQKAMYYKPTLESHKRIGLSQIRRENNDSHKEVVFKELPPDQLSSFEIDDEEHKTTKLLESNCKLFSCNTLRCNQEAYAKPEINRIRSSIVKSKKGFNEKNTKAVSITIKADSNKM